MAELRRAGDGYEARCELCGVWRAVEVRQLACDTFFENFQADFTCCGVVQTAQSAVEKDELDFH